MGHFEQTYHCTSVAYYRRKWAYILGLCDHYTKLDTFLYNCVKSDEELSTFMRMETSCFDDK